MNVQLIEKNGKPEWAIIPFQECKRIQGALEDAEDIKELEENLKAISDTTKWKCTKEFGIIQADKVIIFYLK